MSEPMPSTNGLLKYFIGFCMFAGGGFLLLNSIQVNMGMMMFRFGGMGFGLGSLLIPFTFGVGILFFNARNVLGWLLMVGSLVAIVMGALMTAQLSLRSMSLFEIALILVLFAGGLGLMLSAGREK